MSVESNRSRYPVRYNAAYCKQMIEHMAQGYSFASFAGVLGCSYGTLKKWCDTYPEFQAAKDIGIQRARFWWEQEGMKGLWRFKDGPQLNEKIWLAAMRVRFGWRDNDVREVNLNTKDVAQLITEAERFVTALKEKQETDAITDQDKTDSTV